MAFVRHTIDLNGCKLSFARGGSGLPLLYLHGTDGLAEWPAILDTLAQRFDVVAPDHPGFGASEVPAWIDMSPTSPISISMRSRNSGSAAFMSSGSRSAGGSR